MGGRRGRGRGRWGHVQLGMWALPGVLGIVLGGATLQGCGDGGGETRTEDVPFEGEAWPRVSQPIAVPAAGLGLVTDSLDDTISAIDLGTGAVLATRPVGRNPVDIDGPHHITLDVAGGSAFVALSYPVPGETGPHAGHGGSQALGWVQRLSLSDLSITGQVRVETNPGDIVLSEDKTRLVVSHFNLSDATAPDATLETARATLAIIDPKTVAPTGSPEPRYITTCAAPHGIALSRPDGRYAFVACHVEDSLAVVDLDAPDGAIERYPLGGGTVFGSVAYGPYAAVLSPDGKTVAVASLVSKDLRFFDVENKVLDDRGPVVIRGAAYFPTWSPDGETIWVPRQSPDGIVRVDVASGTFEERAFKQEDGCKLPHEVELFPDGRMALVCEGDHEAPGSVLMIDPDTLETISATPVGVYPDSIERVAPAGGP